MEKVSVMEENVDLMGEETQKKEAAPPERGVIIAPLGRFDEKELAARKIRKIMGID